MPLARSLNDNLRMGSLKHEESFASGDAFFNVATNNWKGIFLGYIPILVGSQGPDDDDQE